MQQVNPVEFAVLKEQVKNLSDLKVDVKSILTTVQKIEIHQAVTPTWTQLQPVLQPLIKDVESLKMSREERKGAKKALLLVGSTIGACSGVLGALATRIFSHPAAASVIQNTAETGRHVSQILK